MRKKKNCLEPKEQKKKKKLARTQRSAFLKITLTEAANETDCKFHKNHCNSMQRSGLETRELEMRGGGEERLMASRMRAEDGRFQREKEPRRPMKRIRVRGRSPTAMRLHAHRLTSDTRAAMTRLFHMYSQSTLPPPIIPPPPPAPSRTLASFLPPSLKGTDGLYGRPTNSGTRRRARRIQGRRKGGERERERQRERERVPWARRA